MIVVTVRGRAFPNLPLTGYEGSWDAITTAISVQLLPRLEILGADLFFASLMPCLKEVVLLSALKRHFVLNDQCLPLAIQQNTPQHFLRFVSSICGR